MILEEQPQAQAAGVVGGAWGRPVMTRDRGGLRARSQNCRRGLSETSAAGEARAPAPKGGADLTHSPTARVREPQHPLRLMKMRMLARAEVSVPGRTDKLTFLLGSEMGKARPVSTLSKMNVPTETA